MTNIHHAFKVTPMSKSLQDTEIQYRFSGFTTANLEINSYIVHGTKWNTLPVVRVGLCVTVGPEKDTGTFTGPSFIIQKVDLVSRHQPADSLHVYSCHVW